MKRTSLLRHTPIRRSRPTPRNRKTIVRLSGTALGQLRLSCWIRDKGKCRDCGVAVVYEARFDGDPDAYDMAHVKSRGAGGSDTLENVVTKCHRCHMREQAKGRAQ